MCGRFTLSTPADTLADAFGIEPPAAYRPRFNVAPTQPVLTARVAADGSREAAWLDWGLIPAWASDAKGASHMINARGETVADKPAFRDAFRQRRCLILCDGFYEWHDTNGHKQPYYFHRPDGSPFAFAGLWEAWHDPVTGDRRETCTLVNTAANGIMATIHERIPVILMPEAYDRWLDPRLRDARLVQQLLQPPPGDYLAMRPVSRAVNKVANDGPALVAEAAPEPPPAPKVKPAAPSLFDGLDS